MGVKIYNSGIWFEIGYNATKLATPVNINNVSFDGSSSITKQQTERLLPLGCNMNDKNN